MENGFLYGFSSVAFAGPALRSGGDRVVELFQEEGRDSQGARYVYDKSNQVRRSFPLEVRVAGEVRADLQNFLLEEVRGCRELFTWYDRGEARAVRLVSPRWEFEQVGPASYMVRLQVEEFLLLPDPPSPLLGLPQGADPWGYVLSQKVLAPVWVLKLQIDGVFYYISDTVFAVPGWFSGYTVPWVGEWGEVRNQVTGDLNEFKVSDFTVDLVNDPSITPGVVELCETYDIEGAVAELYLWARGLDPAVLPPRLMFSGFVREVDIPDDLGVSLTIEDETSRLRNYLGTRLSLENYPDADPDDVGKVLPIIIGTVEKLQTLAVDAGTLTSLPANISATSTSFNLSSGVGLVAGNVVQVDDEQILIGGITVDTVTSCTRGYNGTLAATHLKGAIVWEQQPYFVYLVADHPVDAIPKVHGRVGQTVLDITSLCSRYTGRAGSVLAGYEGKAVVTLPDLITVPQAASYALADGISISDAISIADLISIADGANISDAGHGHTTGSTTASSTQVPVQSLPRSGTLTVGASNPTTYYDIAGATFPDPGGTITAATITITISASGGNNRNGTYMWLVSVSGNGSYQAYTGNSAVNNLQLTLPITNAAAMQCHNIDVWVSNDTSYGITMTATIHSASRQETHIVGGVETTVVTAGVTKSGAVTRAGGVSRGGAVTRAGSVTLTGNSVANTMIGDAVLVDVVHNVSAPAEVFSWLLDTYCGGGSFVQVGEFPWNYRFDGAITQYKQAIYWLDYLAFQCHSFFRKARGVATLHFRPDVPGPPVPIPAVQVRDGVRVYSRRKGPTSEIVNKITVLYGRDYSKAPGPEAYRWSSSFSLPDSIAVYGEKERPELFQFDFVSDSMMADDVRDYYLSRYGWRYWVHEARGFLNLALLDFPDDVSLGFKNGEIGEVRGTGFSPGRVGRIDTVNLLIFVSVMGGAMGVAFAVDNFAIEKGLAFSRDYIMEEADGTPLVLTGCTVTAVIRNSRLASSGTVLALAAAIVETRPGGVLTQTKINVSATLAAVNAVTAGFGFIEIVLTWPDTSTEKIEGDVTFI